MADQSILSSRAVIGMYYARLEQNPGMAWVNGVSNLFNSDQASETYPFLGQNSSMREWIGGRQAKTLSGNSLIITNKHYENTLDLAIKDMRRDKTGQIAVRVNEFVDKSLSHWASLLSTLILNGSSYPCYDGQYFFDTDHSEGSSGTQSNSITCDISTYPATVHGVVTAPSKEEMQQAILQGIAKILSFKDNSGEPMNENATSFMVIVPVGLYLTAAAAVSGMINAALANDMNPDQIAGMNISVQMNPRLTWTDTFAIFRTDSPIKALIRQSETLDTVKIKDESSEYAFDTDHIQLGVDAWRNVGYGYWQRACLVKMV